MDIKGVKLQKAADLAGIDFDLTRIRLPKLVSPKLDGIRAAIIGDVVYSYNMKPIRNRYVQAMLGRKELSGLEGELVVGPPVGHDVLNRTGAVMAYEGEPDFKLYAFDMFNQLHLTYEQRLAAVSIRMMKARCGFVVPLKQVLAERIPDVERLEEKFLAEGYEGIMLRDPRALYKNGRSTPREDDLWKLKRFIDGEGVVIRLEEALFNENEAVTDELGRTKRSSAASGRSKGKGMVGAIIIRDPKWGELRLSPGTMSHQDRLMWWAARSAAGQHILVGKRCHWRGFSYGVKNLPRFPRWYGIREDDV